jgi:hypothetical protein
LVGYWHWPPVRWLAIDTGLLLVGWPLALASCWLVGYWHWPPVGWLATGNGLLLVGWLLALASCWIVGWLFLDHQRSLR